jgi:hypothetical protein
VFIIEEPFNSFKIKHAIKFFLFETGYDSTKIEIKITGVDKSAFVDSFGDEAGIIWGVAYRFGKTKDKYRIDLKKSLLAANETLLVAVLFEELSHVFQYDRGELHHCDTKTRFKGKYHDKNKSYEKCPWEIEAKAQTKKLATKYVRFLKEKYGQPKMPDKNDVPKV